MRTAILATTLLTILFSLSAARAADTIRVSGQVQSPGRYDWYPGMTVVDAVQAAGGLARSTGHHIEITHPDQHRTIFNGDTFPYNVQTPPAVNAGDSIHVPAERIYYGKRMVNVVAERVPATPKPAPHTAPKEH